MQVIINCRFLCSWDACSKITVWEAYFVTAFDFCFQWCHTTHASTDGENKTRCSSHILCIFLSDRNGSKHAVCSQFSSRTDWSAAGVCCFYFRNCRAETLYCHSRVSGWIIVVAVAVRLCPLGSIRREIVFVILFVLDVLVCLLRGKGTGMYRHGDEG